MMVTELDVQLMESHAIRRAAVVAGLGSDFLVPADVLVSLQGSHPELAIGLSDFLSAFREWLEFHRKIEQEGRQGGMTPQEVDEMMILVQRKDAARARFVALVAPGPEETPLFVEQCLEPMLRHVTREVSYLERKDWTWRFHLEECELLQPLGDTARRILGSRGVLVASLRVAVPRHDEILDNLVRVLEKAQKVLESEAAFKDLVIARTAAHRADQPFDAPWGAFDDAAMPQLAAQFIINSVEPGMSSNAAMTCFWATHGEGLTKAAEQIMATHRPVIEAAGAELLSECRSIESELERVRGILASAYGV